MPGQVGLGVGQQIGNFYGWKSVDIDDKGEWIVLDSTGKLTFDSLQNLDLPVIMGCVLYAAFFVVLANAVVDIVYAWLDPRVRRA